MPRASLARLPVELFRDIVERLDQTNSLGSLAALGQVCSDFYVIIDPVLWKNIATRKPEAIYWACRYGRLNTAQRVETLGGRLDRPHAWRMTADTSKHFLSQAPVAKPSQLFGSIVPSPRHLRETVAFPLHLAILSGSLELVRYITSMVPTPMPASRQSSRRLCPCILEDLQYDDSDQASPTWTTLNALHLAICNGYQEIAKHFLPLDNDPSRTTPNMWNGYHSKLAMLFGGSFFRIVDRLLHEGADIDDDLSQGYTPLIHAAILRRPVAVQHLVIRGANVNMVTITSSMFAS
ncbi:hypothetical protein B0T21DRAFT_415449 [Apiosordaria backusii]|uniref:F-box domain-containing protein n=1 Tax=Apiosordaria backusii TaxID=314023 RepID=A0AA40AEH9_9PEZI|nr:hypothetical protein B0T21DRAFT_415449 [Apiosordaria backusii]